MSLNEMKEIAAILSDADMDFLTSAVGFREPDLVVAPDGEPYLYRWFMMKQPQANVYIHLQVASDPERPLHDHPWDNQSVIIAGGYEEVVASRQNFGRHKGGSYEPAYVNYYRRHPGDVIVRPAEEPHRLILPDGVPYTLSVFSTGPKYRDWGFYYPNGWRSYREVTIELDGVLRHVKP